jgi:hypothetical protein
MGRGGLSQDEMVNPPIGTVVMVAMPHLFDKTVYPLSSRGGSSDLCVVDRIREPFLLGRKENGSTDRPRVCNRPGGGLSVEPNQGRHRRL